MQARARNTSWTLDGLLLLRSSATPTELPLSTKRLLDVYLDTPRLGTGVWDTGLPHFDAPPSYGTEIAVEAGRADGGCVASRAKARANSTANPSAPQ
jgi:hypothetical protein